MKLFINDITRIAASSTILVSIALLSPFPPSFLPGFCESFYEVTSFWPVMC